MRKYPAVLSLALIVACPVAAAVKLVVPADLSAADPPALQIAGLAPGSSVEVTSETRTDFTNKLATARAVYVADRRGTVDVGRAAPVEGDYAGVDKTGLFWAARSGRAATGADPVAGEVRLVARVGGDAVARAATRVGPAPGTITVTSVAAFPGSVLARPPGCERLPLIIVLGGSEGGSYTARQIAPLLAARGYAVLGLPYYSPGYDPTDTIAGLPQTFTDIPVDRLEQVKAWAATRADIDDDRVGIWGVSKGGEFAMIAASRFAWLRAVVGVVPSDVVWEGWGKAGPKTASFAVAGKPLPFVHYVGMDAAFARMAKGEIVTLREPHAAGRRAFPDELAAARIPLERYRGTLLLIAGERDNVWPSADMVRAIAASRDRAGLPTEVIIGPDAGHALGDPGYLPAEESAAMLGGTAAGVARTRALAWQATIATFDRSLKPRSAGR